MDDSHAGTLRTERAVGDAEGAVTAVVKGEADPSH